MTVFLPTYNFIFSCLLKQIVEVVLRQGLVHPITSVPYLIALETDAQEVNSKLAHHLLMNMNEKYACNFMLFDCPTWSAFVD